MYTYSTYAGEKRINFKKQLEKIAFKANRIRLWVVIP